MPVFAEDSDLVGIDGGEDGAGADGDDAGFDGVDVLPEDNVGDGGGVAGRVGS